MAKTFCMASDIETQECVWVAFNNGEMSLYNNEPVISNAIEIAAHYAAVYSGEHQ
jgi:hypothetical protein